MGMIFASLKRFVDMHKFQPRESEQYKATNNEN
jgi:hypothetical protein